MVAHLAANFTQLFTHTPRIHMRRYEHARRGMDVLFKFVVHGKTCLISRHLRILTSTHAEGAEHVFMMLECMKRAVGKLAWLVLTR